MRKRRTPKGTVASANGHFLAIFVGGQRCGVRQHSRGIGLALPSIVTTSRVKCAVCDEVSRRYTWGFALMVKNGWQATDGDGAPRWRCSRCAALGKAPPTRSDRLSVLVVDSVDASRQATQRILRDFEVIQALNAQEALHILDSIWFDAIVSDVALPGLRGPEFYELACTRWPHLARRFVFVASSFERAKSDLAAAAERAGHDVPIVLEKPGLHETLIEAVSRAADRNANVPGVRAIRGPSQRTKAFG